MSPQQAYNWKAGSVQPRSALWGAEVKMALRRIRAMERGHRQGIYAQLQTSDGPRSAR